MRQLMKKAITALAVAVGITTAAQAATPELVWEGNSVTATKTLSRAVEKGKPFTLIVHMTNTTDTTAGSYIIGKINANQTITPFCVAADEYTSFTTGGAIPNNSLSYDEKKAGGWWCGVGSRSSTGNATWNEEKIGDGVSQLSSIYVAYSGTVDADGAIANYVRMVFAHKTSGADYTLSNTSSSLTISDALDTMNVNSSISDLAFKVYLDYTSRTVDEIKQTIDDIENPKAGHTATVATATDWSDIVWDPAISDPTTADLTLTVQDGATITLDDTFSYAKIKVVGDATFVAGDGVYTDGCWQKTILGGAFTATGTISFGAVKSGFTGAYAQTANGITLRAQNKEVISINFANGTGNVVSGTGYTGLAPVQGNTWMNMTTTWGSGGKTVDLGTIKATADGAMTTERTDMSGSCYAANTYGYSATDVFLKGYLDDGGNHAQVNVNNIPYSTYDLIVYGATDTSGRGFDGVSINGTTYTCGADGVGTVGNAKWGRSLVATAQYGVNAMIVKGLSLANLAVVGGSNDSTKGTRGGIAAVQIVCTGTMVEEKDFTATVTEDATFSQIEWDGGVTFEEGSLNTATITVGEGEGEVAITFDNPALTLKTVKIVSEERDVKFVATASLSNVSTVDVTECAGKVTYAWPVTALATSANENIAYAGGTAGDAAVGIAHGAAGTTLNLVGGTYKISETHSDVEVTYNVTGETVLNYPDCIGLGKGTYNFGGASAVNALKFVLVQGAGNSDVFNLTDDAVVTVSGTTITDSNQNSVMFGHWSGNSTFTIADNAAFTAADTQILVGRTGGNQTINVNGGTITTKGIKASGQASGTNTLNLNGGALVLGEVGISSYADNRTLAVNVNADTTITATAATLPITQTISIAAGKTLTVVGAECGTALSLGNVTGEGKLVVGANVTRVECGTARPKSAFTFAGATEVWYTENVADDGVVYQLATEGGETPTYRVFDGEGNEKTVTGGKYLVSVSGKAAWYDFTFTNTLTSVGSNTSSLTRDTSYGLAGDVSAYTSDGESIFTAIDGYMSPSYPEVWSAAVYAKVPAVPDAVLMAFGTKAGGAIALITGDTNKNEIVLARTTGDSKYETLAKMTVPNAYVTSHLYSFCKTATTIHIYLDSTLWSVYNSESAISFGGGFQLGSLHGGIGSTGFKQYGRDYYDAEDESNNSTVGALRMFKAALGPNAIKALSEEFSYISPNGSYSRTLPAETEAYWMADGQWKNDETGEFVSKPADGSSVSLTGVATTKVKVNLAADTTYESITLNGESEAVVTIATGGIESFAGKIRASGQVTVAAPVWLDCTAIDISGVPLTLTANGAITFDLRTFDFGAYFADKYVPLTGVSAEYADQIFAALPTETPDREVTFGYDSATKTYGITIAVESYPFVYNEGWTWGGTSVSDETVANNPEQAVVVESDLEWPIDRSGITVSAGTLKATAVTKRAAEVTVAAGAVLDLNGKNAKEMALTLAGGKVTYGSTLPAEADQIKVLTLTADSEICTPVKGQVYAASYATATTIALGEGNTLTKTGTNVLQAVNVDITGMGTIYVKEGEFYGSEDTRATNVTFKVAEGATLHNRGGKTMTFANVVGEGGTLNNEGTVSAFALTGSLKIARSGSYGTVTLANNATLDVGQKRGLTIGGSGTVDVALTDDEFAAGTATVFTPAEGANVKFGTVTHNGSVYSVRTEGGRITKILKGLMFYVK